MFFCFHCFVMSGYLSSGSKFCTRRLLPSSPSRRATTRYIYFGSSQRTTTYRPSRSVVTITMTLWGPFSGALTIFHLLSSLDAWNSDWNSVFFWAFTCMSSSFIIYELLSLQPATSDASSGQLSSFIFKTKWVWTNWQNAQTDRSSRELFETMSTWYRNRWLVRPSESEPRWSILLRSFCIGRPQSFSVKSIKIFKNRQLAIFWVRPRRGSSKLSWKIRYRIIFRRSSRILNQALEGSFAAVSTPSFATKDSFFSVLRDLQDTLRAIYWRCAESYWDWDACGGPIISSLCYSAAMTSASRIFTEMLALK